jgi:uncharacterized membrane protein HdeD (DUF308 family)
MTGSVQAPADTSPLLFSGFISTLLGLIVVTNLLSATLPLVGAIVGVQAIADGIALLLSSWLSLTRAREDVVSSEPPAN